MLYHKNGELNKYADKIYVYWTTLEPKVSVLAAEYSPGEDLVIRDQQAWQNFVDTHGALPIKQGMQKESRTTACA